ncbi:MAG: thioredoxin fold domain-containing protein [Hydrogenophilus sp.]|nr:thioredoxin fold domain-containing protein [Hydrogenophilus sp.]
MKHSPSFPFIENRPLPLRYLTALLLSSIGAILALSFPSPAFAGEIPFARDLSLDGVSAQKAKLPILLYFEREGCPYCSRAERYLTDIAARRPSEAIYRRIAVDRSDLSLTDFAGLATTHAAFAQKQHLTLTPTVVLFAADGRRLTEPLIGLPLEEFYTHYIEQMIAEARSALTIGKPTKP